MLLWQSHQSIQNMHQAEVSKELQDLMVEKCDTCAEFTYVNECGFVVYLN